MNTATHLTVAELKAIVLSPDSSQTEKSLAIACIYQQGRTDGVRDFETDITLRLPKVGS